MIERTLFNEDHTMFRDTVRRFLERKPCRTTRSGKSRAMSTATSG